MPHLIAPEGRGRAPGVAERWRAVLRLSREVRGAVGLSQRLSRSVWWVDRCGCPSATERGRGVGGRDDTLRRTSRLDFAPAPPTLLQKGNPGGGWRTRGAEWQGRKRQRTISEFLQPLAACRATGDVVLKGLLLCVTQLMEQVAPQFVL